MAKKPIYNCTECGRDTTRECEICIRCMPVFHQTSIKFSSKTEQKDRPSLPTGLFSGEDGRLLEEETLQLRSDIDESHNGIREVW